jgi:hypothetical protein
MGPTSIGRRAERVRRIATLVLLCSTVAGQASARQSPVGPTAGSAATDCLSVSPTSQVIVDTTTGQPLRGTLMCLSQNGAWLLLDGHLLNMPLDEVRRIRTTADPVWDGAVIGAVIPLIAWAVLCHDCSAEPWLRMSLTTGLIGLASDVLDINRKTLYQRDGRSASVGWTFRF